MKKKRLAQLQELNIVAKNKKMQLDDDVFKELLEGVVDTANISL